MKRIFFVLVMFLCGCAAAPPNYSGAKASTVLVTDGRGHGTGVIINDRCIVTAAHVVDNEEQFVIVTQDHKEHRVSKKYLAEFSDLAVACADDPLNAPPIRIRLTMPEAYSSVFVIGNPLGTNNIMTSGHFQEDGIFTAAIAWGNSGGGVFTETGQLIGIAVAMHVRQIEGHVFIFPHLGKMTTIRDIVPFLEENHIRFHAAI